MAETISITFYHHGNSHTFEFPPDSTISDLAEEIFSSLSIPQANQKFMITPKLGLLKYPFQIQSCHFYLSSTRRSSSSPLCLPSFPLYPKLPLHPSRDSVHPDSSPLLPLATATGGKHRMRPLTRLEQSYRFPISRTPKNRDASWSACAMMQESKQACGNTSSPSAS